MGVCSARRRPETTTARLKHRGPSRTGSGVGAQGRKHAANDVARAKRGVEGVGSAPRRSEPHPKSTTVLVHGKKFQEPRRPEPHPKGRAGPKPKWLRPTFCRHVSAFRVACLALKKNSLAGGVPNIARLRAWIVPENRPKVDARESNRCEPVSCRQDLDERRSYRHGAAKRNSPAHSHAFSPTLAERIPHSSNSCKCGNNCGNCTRRSSKPMCNADE